MDMQEELRKAEREAVKEFAAMLRADLFDGSPESMRYDEIDDFIAVTLANYLDDGKSDATDGNALGRVSIP